MKNVKVNDACLMEALLFFSKKGNTTIKEIKNSVFFNTRYTKYISSEEAFNILIRSFVSELHRLGFEEVDGIYLEKH